MKKSPSSTLNKIIANCKRVKTNKSRTNTLTVFVIKVSLARKWLIKGHRFKFNANLRKRIRHLRVAK